VTRLDESKNCIVVNDYNATIGSYEGMMQDMLGIQQDSWRKRQCEPGVYAGCDARYIGDIGKMAITTRPVGVRS
jgi:hypothetical protein